MASKKYPERQPFRKGYDPGFLGVKVPFPEVMKDIETDIVVNPENGQKKYIWDYIHYSVVMRKSKKQALYSICNINKCLFQDIKKKNQRKWFGDGREGIQKYQLNEDYFYKNPWDKGHLTRRKAVAWGKNLNAATEASKDSCSFANTSFQHENFNRDEWGSLEDYVIINDDFNDRCPDKRISIITGPVFLEDCVFHIERATNRGSIKTANKASWLYYDLFHSKTLYPKEKKTDPASVPSGFWKIIYYVDKQRTAEAANKKPTLSCLAFLIWQTDVTVTKKKDSEKSFYMPGICVCQVTTNQISDLTGIKFAKALYDANPLYYFVEGDRDIKEPERYLIKMHQLTQSQKTNDKWTAHIIHERSDMAKFERLSK